MNNMLRQMTPDARVHYAQLCAIQAEQTNTYTTISQMIESA